MSGSPACRADVEALVADYRADLIAAGMFADNPVTSVARMFFSRVGVEGWARLSLAEQCALPLKDRRVVGWLIVTGRVQGRVRWSVVRHEALWFRVEVRGLRRWPVVAGR